MEEEEGDVCEVRNVDTELDGFKDFTVSSSWERLIAAVESICQEWLSAGRKNLLAAGAENVEGACKFHRVHAEVAKGSKNYLLEFFFSSVDQDELYKQSADVWKPDLHRLQLWFGVKEFIVISPVSLSGVLLDAPEATMLLSTVTVALSNCGSMWPVFVPVHDPTRKAYMGIQSSMSSYSFNFEADRLGSQVPVKLMHLEGLYELFISKLGLASSEDIPQLGFTMRLTYAAPIMGLPFLPNPVSPKESDEVEAELDENIQWDEEFLWAEWLSVEDPIKGFELVTIWNEQYVSSSTDLAEFENVSSFDADKWLLRPLLSRKEEQNSEGFARRLRALITSFSMSKDAEFMEDFVAVVKPHIQDATHFLRVPPPTVLDRVLKDIFYQAPQASSYGNYKGVRLIKGAPSDSLFGRFCLHSLWFGSCNIRAIAVLWIEFVREVRWCWEELQPLPRCSHADSLDYDTCLIHQKLQLLATCIEQRILKMTNHHENSDAFNSTSSTEGDGVFSSAFKKSRLMKDSLKSTISLMDVEEGEMKNGFRFDDEERKGSGGALENMFLARSNQQIHAPLTQIPPIMTEDMLIEREHALAALDSSPSGNDARIRLQSDDILASDMAAFKAANPGAVIEDFIKWHSPRDWVEEEGEYSQDANLRTEYSNRRGRLSKRMSQPGNTWQQTWQRVRPIPAIEQKPLFDYTREGEKVMHYLDTLRPHQLLAQMVCCAFVCAGDVLRRTPGAEVASDVAREVDELYSNMGVLLNPLSALTISDVEMLKNVEAWEGNLMQLCTAFENVESNIWTVASLKQKLMDAPDEMVDEIYGNLGGSTEVRSYREREMIKERVFNQQNVSEVWKESIRMGNYLNGHEPMWREIIFSQWKGKEKSHRMYICGSSNDLQIAMSVRIED